MAKKTVAVKILDQEFNLSTDASPERVQQIASFLNQRLEELQSKAKNLTPYRAVILAALTITENYFALLDKQSKFKSTVSDKSKKILELLESRDNSPSAS